MSRKIRGPSDRRVLLIEDDFSIEPLFEKLLQDIDPNIVLDTVTSGEDAMSLLEKVQDVPYSLVISDIFLEGKVTGVDVWSVIQRVNPNLPILVMSGLSRTKVFEFLGNSGESLPFLEKPIRFQEARQILQGMLNRQ